MMFGFSAASVTVLLSTVVLDGLRSGCCVLHLRD
jgi:hypothetical protein